MAATTHHPSRYRRTADAKPSPRDAPVTTTLRGSAILARTGAYTRRRVDVWSPVGLPARPSRPDAHRVRALGAGLLVKTLRVIDFGLGVRPRAGHRGRRVADLDGPEPCSVDEVRHV